MGISEADSIIRAFLIEELEIDPAQIAPAARLRTDLGIDSLDVVDVAAMIKEQFGIRITTEQMKQLQTYEELCQYVADRG